MQRRPMLKCGACQHRWVPGETGETLDEDAAVAAVQEELRTARAPEPEPAPVETPAAPAADPPPERTGLKWLLAIALGAAFTAASAGLWIGRIDPMAIPGVADALAGITPPPARLDVAIAGSISRLDGGARLLEVTGTIRNPGRSRAVVPPLNARLLIDGRPARDWTIPPPAAGIAPGQRLAFASTITDVPDGAVSVQVRFGR